jgi:winged helix-turn helix protein
MKGQFHPCPEEPIMPRRQLVLSETERQVLVKQRDHAPEPYLRERAAALLKIADGLPAARVAKAGLLRPRRPETVYAWLERYQAAGWAGLRVQPGRGRKPAFSPAVCHSHGGPQRVATPLPA